MNVAWSLLILVTGAVLVLWTVLIFAYALVTRCLERDLNEDRASEASSIDALEESLARHPAGRSIHPDYDIGPR